MRCCSVLEHENVSKQIVDSKNRANLVPLSFSCLTRPKLRRSRLPGAVPPGPESRRCIYCTHYVLLVFSAVFTATAVLGEGATPKNPAPAKPTPRQKEYLKASPQERIRISEKLGEDGARNLAKAKGYEPIFEGVGRTLLQGPDASYRGPDTRKIVVESKGGASEIGVGYGFRQDSTEWAVESSKRVARSPTASAAEKAAALELLNAAAEAKLEVHVVRTKHVLGEPTSTIVESVITTSDDAVRLAQSALKELKGAGAGTAGDAGLGGAAGLKTVAKATDGIKATRTASKALVGVGVFLDAGFRANDAAATERQFASGKISEQHREIEHSKNAAGLVGGWSGAVAGAEVGAVAGGCVAGPPGAAVGGTVGGVAGYYGGEKAAEASAEWAVDRLHKTGTTIRGEWKRTWTR